MRRYNFLASDCCDFQFFFSIAGLEQDLSCQDATLLPPVQSLLLSFIVITRFQVWPTVLFVSFQFPRWSATQSSRHCIIIGGKHMQGSPQHRTNTSTSIGLHHSPFTTAITLGTSAGVTAARRRGAFEVQLRCSVCVLAADDQEGAQE